MNSSANTSIMELCHNFETSLPHKDYRAQMDPFCGYMMNRIQGRVDWERVKEVSLQGEAVESGWNSDEQCGARAMSNGRIEV
jgi:hypothetical protein